MDEMIKRARDRLRRLRKVAEMAHNPEIFATVTKIADELEADILTVESQRLGEIDHKENDWERFPKGG